MTEQSTELETAHSNYRLTVDEQINRHIDQPINRSTIERIDEQQKSSKRPIDSSDDQRIVEEMQRTETEKNDWRIRSLSNWSMKQQNDSRASRHIDRNIDLPRLIQAYYDGETSVNAKIIH